MFKMSETECGDGQKRNSKMSVVKCKNRKNTKKNNKYIIETKTENVT